MKKILYCLAGILIFMIFLVCGQNRQKTETGDLSGDISISGAFALYPITVKWAEEFRKIHPDVKINISAGGAGKGMADALSGMVDLGMFSRKVSPEEKVRGAWYIALTKDAVLPTINSNNPIIHELKIRGADREELKHIFIEGNLKTWNELADGKKKYAINVYTRSDACGAAAMWAEYLNAKQEDLLGTGVYADPGVADAVKNDKNALGYNNVIYIYDINTRKKYEHLEVLPIDLNSNDTIDEDERIYDNLDLIMQAIKEGVYPSPPARELYFVSKGKPENKAAIAFIQWILTDGQKYLRDAGYVQLSETRINEELEKLK